MCSGSRFLKHHKYGNSTETQLRYTVVALIQGDCTAGQSVWRQYTIELLYTLPLSAGCPTGTLGMTNVLAAQGQCRSPMLSSPSRASSRCGHAVGWAFQAKGCASLSCSVGQGGTGGALSLPFAEGATACSFVRSQGPTLDPCAVSLVPLLFTTHSLILSSVISFFQFHETTS